MYCILVIGRAKLVLSESMLLSHTTLHRKSTLYGVFLPVSTEDILSTVTIQRASAMLAGYSGENVLCRALTENTIKCGLAVEGGVAQ